MVVAKISSNSLGATNSTDKTCVKPYQHVYGISLPTRKFFLPLLIVIAIGAAPILPLAAQDAPSLEDHAPNATEQANPAGADGERNGGAQANSSGVDTARKSSEAIAVSATTQPVVKPALAELRTKVDDVIAATENFQKELANVEELNESLAKNPHPFVIMMAKLDGAIGGAGVLVQISDSSAQATQAKCINLGGVDMD